MYPSTEKTLFKKRKLSQLNSWILSKNLAIKSACSFLALLVSLISTPLKSEAAIIKKYDFESGNFSGVGRQYQDKTCSSSSSYIDNSLFDIVDAPGGRSGKAVKHHIKNCDERSELAVPGIKTEQEYWFGWSYFIPANFLAAQPGKPNFTIIQQMGYSQDWKEQIDGKMLVECNEKITSGGKQKTRGAPGSHITLSPDGKNYNYNLKYYKGKDSQGRTIMGCKEFSIPAQVNTWQDFVINVNFSGDASEGFIKIWKNDKLYIDEKIALVRPGVDLMSAWKIGAYVGDPGRGERILYTDELRVGDSAASYLDVVAPARKEQLLGFNDNSLAFASFADSEISPVQKLQSSITVEPASVPEPNLLVSLLSLGGAALGLRAKRN